MQTGVLESWPASRRAAVLKPKSTSSDWECKLRKATGASKSLTVLLLLLFGIAAFPHQVSAQTTGFVEVQDGQLVLGGARLRLVGVNSFGLLSGYLNIGQVTEPSSFQKIADSVQAHGRIYRFWTEISGGFWFDRVYTVWSADVDHHSYLEGMRKLIQDLKANGIYGLPTLVSAPRSWSSLAGGSNFWFVGSQANLKWKEWIKSIVVYFKDEPQILAWELANEANDHASSCSGGCATTDELILWGKDTYDYIKSLDPNHLVTGGWDNTGNLGVDLFKKLNSFLDIASLHVFDQGLYNLVSSLDTKDKQETDAFVSQYVTASKEIGKPFMIGEFGADLAADPRNPFLRYLLSSMYDYDGDAAILWSWEEGTDVFRLDVSNTYQADLVAQWSVQMEFAGVRSTVQDLIGKLDSLESATRGLEKRIENLTIEVESATRGFQTRLDALVRELDSVRARTSSLESDLANSNRKLQDAYTIFLPVGIAVPSIIAILVYLLGARKHR